MKRAYHLALRVTGSAAMAEDALQDAWVRIASGRRPDVDALPVWLLRAVHSCAVSLVRSEVARRVREEVVAVEGAPRPESAGTAAERREMAAAAREELERLPADMRVAVALCCEQGLTQSEAAEVMEVPRGTVARRVQLGLEKLRQRLAARGFAGAALAPLVLTGALGELGLPEVPAGLSAGLAGLRAEGGAPACSGALKGGFIVKIGLAVAAVGLAAGATFRAAGGKSAETAPLAPSATTAEPVSDWRQEQWTVENFTGALGGGPGWGPVEECGARAYSVCGDAAGNMYIANGQAVDIVTREGVRHRLAGTGEAGYHDGPAETAQFKIGIGAYYGAFNIQADGRGNVFVPDNGNGCVRRIFKSAEGKWTVETWAGGGKRKLKAGESCPAREAELSGTLMVAAAQEGQVTIASQWTGCLQVSPDGRTITGRGPWPAYRGQANPEKGNAPPWQGGDCDRAGNAYFVSRTPDLIYRVTPEGKMEHIGITPAMRAKRPGDGPPLEIYFDTPDSGCCAPDGSGVYVCGGDEYDIRKVPTDMVSPSATLMNNGRWYSVTTDPKSLRGVGMIDPALSGKPRNEGGPLTVFLNCHIAGRDHEGNLYGWQYHWCGTTVATKEKGLLGTRVYRIRRVK
jgi:RNA polymerase sigma factor (sigma-70 family)